MSDLKILAGAYDLHVHCSPDAVPRAQSAWELAQDASSAGLAGVGLKDHCTCTVGRCNALNEAQPGGPQFFSSIVLNPTVGGLNPEAVETALKSGCDIVYFPTFASAHQIQDGFKMPYPVSKGFHGISIFGGDQQLKPEVVEILRLISRHKAVLATGHLSSRESPALLAKAATEGVSSSIVTHASEPIPGMSIDEQKASVALGAKIEHCLMACTTCCSPPLTMNELAGQIQAVGTEHIILSSDFGQVPNGPPVRAFAKHLHELMAHGITRDAIDTMIRDNPRTLMADRISN